VPEYLAPGVYVEETSFRAKSIEGVSTSTTGFVGPAKRGPVAPSQESDAPEVPELLTSFGDFQRIFGGFEDLDFASDPPTNYLAHAVRTYFDNGGARLYVARVTSSTGAAAAFSPALVTSKTAKFVARTPGSGGNGTISLVVHASPAIKRVMDRAPRGMTLRVPSSGNSSTVYTKQVDGSWSDGTTPLSLGSVADGDAPAAGAELLSVSIITQDASGLTRNYDDLGPDPAHPRFVGKVLAQVPGRRVEQLENVFALDRGDATDAELRAALTPAAGHATFVVSGGKDGSAPAQIDYEAGLRQLAQVEDISIVAAPGSSAYAEHPGIQGALVSHAERRRAYRIAVLDTKPGIIGSEARAEKARIDSSYAALYYPWVVVANPLARPGDESIPREIALPPSGFVTGIYARSDVNRGVFKAPANEVVRGALRYDVDVNFAQQEVLNPLGVNCLRFFPGRGNRVWGARTTSSDPEWKYVNVRRYFAYVERSIDTSTQWAVFEPNGEALWANIRDAVSSFLNNEWRSGALLGESPREAFFVRCDRSTMDQNDLDNGRLVCVIGIAVVKPAEFVIFRIGQKTADARS
jgi:phage tail sheath protein FI